MRRIAHAELDRLTVAHIDCDAFYASVEKRDDPSLTDRPVIVGGGRRGVVSTACYVARMRGVRSAMPMFKALAACPDAVVIRPAMDKYAAVARDVRARMRALTPLVEPLSLDEAFLDLTGTERVHGRTAAESLAALARVIEHDVGITVSVGLSYCKFLAKIASELDKPRGFAVIGRTEAHAFLAPRPVTIVPGVGPALAKSLARDGIDLIGRLQEMEKGDLMARYGAMGARLYHLARGEDTRAVEPLGDAKSISSETTFEHDVSGAAALDPILWRLCEKVAARAKRAGLGGRTITLKLKTSRFELRSRAVTLSEPTQLAGRIYAAGRRLLGAEAGAISYRLIGIGLSHLEPDSACDAPALLDEGQARRDAAERAMDVVRTKFGGSAIGKGRGLRR